MGEPTREQDGQLHLWLALAALVVAACLMFLAATPEPCHDPNTTACAVPYRTEP